MWRGGHYTGDDEPWALWISRVLEETGYRVLVQARDFGPGLFPVAMEEAVQRTRLLVPVLSDNYLKSKYGLQEWAAFAGTPEQIIPVKVQDVVAFADQVEQWHTDAKDHGDQQ